MDLTGWTKGTDDGQPIICGDSGAKGDGFTNDTAAIQSALDKASAHGGGTVVIPGDDSLYGQRYVVTHLLLRDNTELCIETGAVLWQSPRLAISRKDGIAKWLARHYFVKR